MTKDKLIEIFPSEDGASSFLGFDKILPKKFNTKAPDLYAFLLIDSLAPMEYDILSAAEHDEIFLSVNLDNLASNATKQDILDLIRCGIRYDSDADGLAMFV